LLVSRKKCRRPRITGGCRVSLLVRGPKPKDSAFCGRQRSVSFGRDQGKLRLSSQRGDRQVRELNPEWPPSTSFEGEQVERRSPSPTASRTRITIAAPGRLRPWRTPVREIRRRSLQASRSTTAIEVIVRQMLRKIEVLDDAIRRAARRTSDSLRLLDVIANRRPRGSTSTGNPCCWGSTKLPWRPMSSFRRPVYRTHASHGSGGPGDSRNDLRGFGRECIVGRLFPPATVFPRIMPSRRAFDDSRAVSSWM